MKNWVVRISEEAFRELEFLATWRGITIHAEAENAVRHWIEIQEDLKSLRLEDLINRKKSTKMVGGRVDLRLENILKRGK